MGSVGSCGPSRHPVGFGIGTGSGSGISFLDLMASVSSRADCTEASEMADQDTPGCMLGPCAVKTHPAQDTNLATPDWDGSEMTEQDTPGCMRRPCAETTHPAQDTNLATPDWDGFDICTGEDDDGDDDAEDLIYDSECNANQGITVGYCSAGEVPSVRLATPRKKLNT